MHALFTLYVEAAACLFPIFSSNDLVQAFKIKRHCNSFSFINIVYIQAHTLARNFGIT